MSLQEKLYRLFLLDKQVRGMRRRLDTATGDLDRQQVRLDRLRQQHGELGQQIKQSKAKETGLEHQARDMEGHIATLRERMNAATNNKEYSALLIEVNALKAQISTIEDEALNQLSQVDMLQSEIDQLQVKLEAQEKMVKDAAARAEQCRAETGTQLDDLTAQRATAEQELPPETRKTFNRLAAHQDEQALAEVIEEDRRSMTYICGGCYMSLPFEHVNALLARRDDVVCCTSCGRFLYLGEALKGSLASK